MKEHLKTVGFLVALFGGVTLLVSFVLPAVNTLILLWQAYLDKLIPK